MLFVLAGILGFITIAGLGFAFAGGDSAQAKAAKRAQVIAKGGERQASVRADLRAFAHDHGIALA